MPELDIDVAHLHIQSKIEFGAVTLFIRERLERAQTRVRRTPELHQQFHVSNVVILGRAWAEISTYITWRHTISTTTSLVTTVPTRYFGTPADGGWRRYGGCRWRWYGGWWWQLLMVSTRGMYCPFIFFLIYSIEDNACFKFGRISDFSGVSRVMSIVFV